MSNETPRVMLCTAFGPSKDYCRPFALDVIGRMQGISAVALLYDGTPSIDGIDMPDAPSERIRDLCLPGADGDYTAKPVCEIALPPWDGCEDKHRYGRLARMRSALREAFLRSDCDYLYWHDVDTIPPYDIIPRLLELNQPVTTGGYSFRDLGHAFLPGMDCKGEEDASKDIRTFGAFGMGCMLVRRENIERTPFRAPEYWKGKDAPGEDWQWSWDDGTNVICDTRLSCWHVGDDGRGSRIRYGPPVTMASYMSEEPLDWQGQTWRRGMSIIGSTLEEFADMPHGFVYGPTRGHYLDWLDVNDILAGVEPAIDEEEI